jgi:hypothetical protein
MYGPCFACAGVFIIQPGPSSEGSRANRALPRRSEGIGEVTLFAIS